MSDNRARIVISTKPCGHCEGTGVRPSDEMIEAAQQAIERGFLDSDGILALVEEMYALARREHREDQSNAA